MRSFGDQKGCSRKNEKNQFAAKMASVPQYMLMRFDLAPETQQAQPEENRARQENSFPFCQCTARGNQKRSRLNNRRPWVKKREDRPGAQNASALPP